MLAGYFLKHFCGERDSYSVNGDLVVYERLNQPATPGDEDCPSFPTYIRGTVTRTCIHDSETDQSYVYYCDGKQCAVRENVLQSGFLNIAFLFWVPLVAALLQTDDGMSRAVFDGPNCQGVGTVTGKHLGSDECVDADQMPFLNATTGHASFTCVSNVYDLSDDDGFDWVTEQTGMCACACCGVAESNIASSKLFAAVFVENSPHCNGQHVRCYCRHHAHLSGLPLGCSELLDVRRAHQRPHPETCPRIVRLRESQQGLLACCRIS